MPDATYGVQLGIAPSSTTPPNLLGGGTLLDWWRSDAVTGVSDGSQVPAASLVDQGSNAHNFTSISGGGGVLRVGTGPNSKNWMDFSTPGGYSGASVTEPAGDFTYFAVIKTASSTVQDVVGAVGTGGAELQLSAFRLNVNRDGVAGVASSQIVLRSAVWSVVIVTYVKSTGVTTFRIDNVSHAVAGTSGVTFTSPGAVRLGSYQGGGTFNFGGGMLEVGRYTSVLSSGDLALLLAYCQGRYALPGTQTTAIITYAFASSEANGSNTALMAIDGSFANKWASASSTGILAIVLAAPVVVTQYQMYPSSDGNSACPKNWTFEGSNDNSTWTTIDTQTNVTVWTAATYKTFTIVGNTTAYAFYRWNITADNGGANLGIQEVTVSV